MEKEHFKSMKNDDRNPYDVNLVDPSGKIYCTFKLFRGHIVLGRITEI